MPKEANNKKERKHFFKDFKAELKKVIWPSPKQLVNNTVAVITIVLITAVIVFALDFAFEKMNTFGINKIKQAVESKNEVSDETTENSETEETAEEETVEESAGETTEETAPAETSETETSETEAQAE